MLYLTSLKVILVFGSSVLQGAVACACKPIGSTDVLPQNQHLFPPWRLRWAYVGLQSLGTGLYFVGDGKAFSGVTVVIIPIDFRK